jgi:hypothetical protein
MRQLEQDPFITHMDDSLGVNSVSLPREEPGFFRRIIATGAVIGSLLAPAMSLAAEEDATLPVNPEKVTNSISREVSCDPDTPVISRPPLSVGDTGTCVGYAQALLIGHGRVSFIDGIYGAGTKDKVTSFQVQNRLKPDGVLGRATWAKLSRPKSFHGIPAVCRDKARDTVCISKQQQIARVFVKGKYKFATKVRFGDSRGLDFITSSGIHSVKRKEKMSWSNPYKVWLPYAVYFYGGQAIHYSQDFADYGYSGASHGCANVADMSKAKRIYLLMNPRRDRVIVY